MNKIKVIYIMGTARSGSTILEVMLAHGENCVGAGELSSIVQDGFIDNKICSCGAPFNKCGFWSQVVSRLAFSKAEIEDWARLQKSIDWHAGFIRQLFHLISARDIECYRRYNHKLLQAICEVSGNYTIIDASKYAGRALALSSCDAIDLSIICLTRSPEGLMASFQKPNKDEQYPKKPWAVLRYYGFVMLSLRIAMFKLHGAVLSIVYEDLVKRPTEILALIAEAAKVSLGGVIKTVEHQERFSPGHIVTGNRLRKAADVYFEFVQIPSVTTPRSIRTPVFFMRVLNYWFRRTTI